MIELLEFLKNNEIFIRIVEEFANSNYPITDKIIEKNENILNDFKNQYIKCEPGHLRDCKQQVRGMQISLSYRDTKFYITYLKCAHYEYDNRNFLIKSNYLYSDFNIDAFPNTIKTYLKCLDSENIFNEEEKKERKKLINNAGEIIVNYLENLHNEINSKGFYIWGSPGIGKTTILRSLANEAAKRGGKIVFCTAPAIIEVVKEQFVGQEKNQKKLSKNLKECDVLFIDDFGGEMVSAWSRDNFWFSILNYRMDHKKLTFFTSNFKYSELHNIYVIKGNPKDIELKKFNRLKERINSLALTYNLKGNKSKRNF